ncbi:unnamed protein product, partial [Laminaria digitata]
REYKHSGREHKELLYINIKTKRSLYFRPEWYVPGTCWARSVFPVQEPEVSTRPKSYYFFFIFIVFIHVIRVLTSDGLLSRPRRNSGIVRRSVIIAFWRQLFHLGRFVHWPFFEQTPFSVFCLF